MAEYYFWGTDNDEQAIIAAILATGEFKLTPEVFYARDKRLVVRRRDGHYRSPFPRKRSLYITGEFSRGKLLIRDVQSSSAKHPLVGVEWFGPAQFIVLNPSFCQQKAKGLWHLSNGTLQLKRDFWDGGQKVEKPWPGTKEAYGQLVKIITSHTSRWKFSPRVRIGPEALTLLKSGKAVIRTRGSWQDYEGNVVFERPNASSGTMRLTILLPGP